jgi:dienelactone hydrolase
MVDVRARPLSDPEGVWVEPVSGARTGVLVLAGSSGSVDERRATWLAERGAAAASIRWFGGTGQPPGICEVPLETFTPLVDALAADFDRVAVAGTSKGGEAALLLAAGDSRIDAVIALAAPHVVWANVGPGPDGEAGPARSSWTRAGVPLPFVPYDDDWDWTGDGPPAFLGLYDRSLETNPESADAAAIPVERITGEVVVVAGGDDQVWNSVRYAAEIERRRRAHGLETTVVTHPDAGHRAVLPGEPAAEGGMAMARGGSPAADAALGELAWPAIRAALRLGE